MLYKHFFAALVAAFFLSAGTISAQKDIKTISKEEFEQLVETDAPTVYRWAVDKKLNLDQLEFVIHYELSNERNIEYLASLNESYWQQLTHKDKLNFQRMQFVEEYSHLSFPEGQPYEFSRGLKYVIQHQAEYKKAWGDSLFNRFILDYANADCHEIDLYPYLEEVEPLETRKQKAEKHLALIKANLPNFEPYMRSDIYCRCVYDYKTEQELYYSAINDFLMTYETDPDKFNTHTSDLVRANVDVKYKELGLKWIDKAIELENDPSNVICKAELLYQLGKKDEAYRTLITVKSQADADKSWINTYYRRVEQLVATGK